MRTQLLYDDDDDDDDDNDGELGTDHLLNLLFNITTFS